MSAPCVAHPVDRVGQPQPVQSLLATATHSANVKSRRTASLLPCDGPSIAYTVRCRPRFLDQRAPGPGVDEQAVPQHNRRSGAGAANVQPPEVRAAECGAGVIMAMLPITSDSETSVAVGSSVAMATSRPLPPDRLAIGQVLVRLLLEFRADLAGPRAKRGYSDVRDPHSDLRQSARRVRLPELAARAQLSLAATWNWSTIWWHWAISPGAPTRPTAAPSSST